MSTLANPMPVSPDLRAIARWCESNGDYSAMRFERKTFNTITDQGTTPVLLAIQKANKCSMDTARMIYSTSWGAYQIMGFNLYGGLGVVDNIIIFLLNRERQDNAFDNFVNSKGINYAVADLKRNSASLDNYALKYNGSTAYAERVSMAIRELKL